MTCRLRILVPLLLGLAVPPVWAQQALIGTYQGAGCVGREKLAAHERWLGRPVDVVLDGPSQESWKLLTGTMQWLSRCWAGSGKRMVLSLPMLPKDGVSTLAEGAAGKYDDSIREVARALIEHGHADTIVRIGFEFNGYWFHWNSLKEPEAWKAYWRRIVKVMRAVPGAKFEFDWSPIIGPGQPSPEPAYPGDDVVDYIGADVYNGNWNPDMTPAQRWGHLREAPFGLKWHLRFAAARGKRISFPEWGTGTRPDGHGGGDDPVFMREMVDWIRSQPVAYHIYWDYPADDYNGRLSDGSQPKAEAVFLDAFGRRR